MADLKEATMDTGKASMWAVQLASRKDEKRAGARASGKAATKVVVMAASSAAPRVFEKA